MRSGTRTHKACRRAHGMRLGQGASGLRACAVGEAGRAEETLRGRRCGHLASSPTRVIRDKKLAKLSCRFSPCSVTRDGWRRHLASSSSGWTPIMLARPLFTKLACVCARAHARAGRMRTKKAPTTTAAMLVLDGR